MLRRAERVFLLVLVTMSLPAAAAFGAGAAPQDVAAVYSTGNKTQGASPSQTAQAASAQPQTGQKTFKSPQEAASALSSRNARQ